MGKKTFKIVVIGSGYVGLVTGIALTTLGHKVVAVDVNPRRVAELQAGNMPFYEPGLEALLTNAIETGTFTATSNLEAAMEEADISIIAVGTPSTEKGIDLQFVSSAALEIGSMLNRAAPFHVVTVKSTVVPMTTETVVRQALERASGRIAGVGFGLAMNPEFLREGNAVDDALEPDRIVLGTLDPRTDALLREMYAGFDCPIISTTPRNAEMIKYASNALLATLISYSNDIASLCESCDGLSEESVMEGVFEDRRFWCPDSANRDRLRPGLTSYLRAGIGFGGSCFPKDVKALTMFAAGQGREIRVIEAALKVNELRSEAIVSMIDGCLNGGVRGRRIALLGLAFKPDTDDLRESPSLRILKALGEFGAKIVCHDPMADYDQVAASTGVYFERAPDAVSALRGANAAIIATSWQDYKDVDWERAAETMADPIVFDGRQVIPRESRLKSFTYLSSGVKPFVRKAEKYVG